MPYDVLKLATRIDEIRNELEIIINTTANKEQYSVLKENLILLAALQSEFLKPDKDGNFAKLSREKIAEYKTASSRVLSETRKLLSIPGEDEPTKHFAKIGQEIMPLLLSDQAVLDAVDPEKEPMTLPEILEKGRFRVLQTDADFEVPENGCFVQVENEEDMTLETGVFQKTVDEAPFAMATAFGKPDLAQKTRPMMLVHGEKTENGIFIEDARGFQMEKASPEDPVLSLDHQNMNNPVVYGDMAAAQIMDTILGIGRGPEGFALRFTKDKKPILTGFTMLSDPGQGEAPQPEDLFVIGEGFYKQLRGMDEGAFFALSKAHGMEDAAIRKAWEKKQSLLQKIEGDQAYFAEKEEGYLEKGKIRIIPDEQWNCFDMQTLSKVSPKSYFSLISRIPSLAREKQGQNKELQRPTVTGRFVGNELVHGERLQDPDTLKLAIPPLSAVKVVGNALSKRYAIAYKDEEGIKKGFFTPAKEYSLQQDVNNIFMDAIEKNPKYQGILTDLRDYFVGGKESIGSFVMGFKNENVPIPFREMGYTDEEADELRSDYDLFGLWAELQAKINDAAKWENTYQSKGFSQGQRIELKNVAMSDVADELHMPHLLARSVPCQVGSGGHMIDGVFMEMADGVDLQKTSPDHPVFHVDPDKVDSMFDTEEGLKSIADLQILDYICMNTDRHTRNMFYRFADLDTDHPKFIGVIGIDNDLSFGTWVPNGEHAQVHLPALDNMKVISEEMVKELNNGQLFERLQEKMKQRGLKDAEIEALQTRIKMVREAVESDRIRVVKKGEWGKGENTFLMLASSRKEKNTYYDRINKQVRKLVEAKAEENKQAREEGEPRPVYEAKDPVRFSMAKKVDGFGKTLLQDKEMKQITRQAYEEYKELIKDKVKKAPNEGKYVLEADTLEHIRQTAKEMYDNLDSVDPFWMWSSTEYSKLKKTCKEMISLASSLKKKALGGNNGWLKKKDRLKMDEKLNELRDCVVAYIARKEDDIQKEQRDYKTIEKARMKMSARVAGQASLLVKQYKESSLHSPMEWLRYKLAKTQSQLTYAKGQDLTKKAAQVLYLRSLSETEIRYKKSVSLLNSMTDQEIQKGTEEILNRPAFQKIAELPEKELRRLASQRNAADLMKHFKAGLVEEKKSQKISVDINRGK